MDYCLQHKMPVAIPAGYPSPKFYFAGATPSGDNLFFYPRDLKVLDNEIAVSTSTRYRDSKDGASSEFNVTHFRPFERKYMLENRSEYLAKTQSFRDLPKSSWSTIEKGSVYDKLLKNLLVYCTDNNIIINRNASSFILPSGRIHTGTSVSNTFRYYYVPESVKFADGIITVRLIGEFTPANDGDKYWDTVASFNVSQRQYRVFDNRYYDEKGQATRIATDGTWRPIPAGAMIEGVFIKVLDYCRTNNILPEQ